MTAQFPDRLTFEGRACSLLSNPLEAYFERHPPRPLFVAESTANWRGYIASWEITDGRLFLTDLKGSICTREPEKGGERSSWCGVGHHGECVVLEVTLSGILEPDLNGRVFADWVNEEFRLPAGEMIEYVHAGYGSKYERYLMVQIADGLVTDTRIIGWDEFAKEQKAYWEARRKAEKPWWCLW
jgi:hypothetical protein